MDYKIGLEIVKNIECKGKKVGDYYYDEETDTLSFSLPSFPLQVCSSWIREDYCNPNDVKASDFFKIP